MMLEKKIYNLSKYIQILSFQCKQNATKNLPGTYVTFCNIKKNTTEVTQLMQQMLCYSNNQSNIQNHVIISDCFQISASEKALNINLALSAASY